MFKTKRKYPLTLDIQYFAEGGDASGNDSGEGGEDNSGSDNGAQPVFTPDQEAAIQKLLTSAQDKVRNELGKKNKELQTTIEQLKNQGKSKEELAADAQRQLEEGQRALLSEKNKFHAIQQLADSGLNSGLLSFVLTTEGEDEEARNASTDAKIQQLRELIDSQVTAQVEEKFKQVGYKPGNGNQSTQQSGFKSMSDAIRSKQIKK